jgi:hypothetical protein
MSKSIILRSYDKDLNIGSSLSKFSSEKLYTVLLFYIVEKAETIGTNLSETVTIIEE